MIGTNPLLRVRSQYDIVWYEPTAGPAGRRRPLVHLPRGRAEDTRLADLPAALPKLGKKMPDSIARCGAPRTLAYTTCADRHAWPRDVLLLRRPRSRPKRTANAAAAKVCPRHVPNPKKWLLSTHELSAKKFIVVCYAKTKR